MARAAQKTDRGLGELLLGAVDGPALRLRLGLVGALLLLLLGMEAYAAARLPRYSKRAILDAIWQVESSGRLDPPDGDGGRAIGPYQIHKIYWTDAELPHGGYQDCRDPAYAEQVIRAYMKRWVPEAWAEGHAEVIARTHNGGPRGRFKRATLPYWKRVKRALRNN